MQRSHKNNLGFIHVADVVPDDKIIAGAVLVLVDEYGNYSTAFKAESFDCLPDVDGQEHIGGYVAQAFEIANLTGLGRDNTKEN